jgi:hypothetical protein
MATISNYLDRYFEPVESLLTPDLARKISGLQPDTEITARILELGEKAAAGMLTEDERIEYQDYVDAGDLIALLKAKARRYLAAHSG